MIVVSNTSPLTNLAAVGQFDLLQHLYQQVHIPMGVGLELNANGQIWPGGEEVAVATWVHKHTVVNSPLINALMRDLDRGEAEAIALAIQIGADLLLMDEKDGRRLAQRHGLNIVGVLGILLDAKRQKLIEQVMPSVDALRLQAGFYLNPQVYQMIRTLAAE